MGCSGSKQDEAGVVKSELTAKVPTGTPAPPPPMTEEEKSAAAVLQKAAVAHVEKKKTKAEEAAAKKAEEDAEIEAFVKVWVDELLEKAVASQRKSFLGEVGRMASAFFSGILPVAPPEGEAPAAEESKPKEESI
mmetsp:Transcript_34332/g.58803  ORF Transcript_34332/g.58803 Transcript_34332/m.58803 type:complete len:135 (-) Transcript_34332:558-962(-)